MRNAPEVEAVYRAVIVRGKTAGVDGLPLNVVVTRGGAVRDDDLSSVVGRGVALGPAAAGENIVKEDEEEYEDDVLHGARAGAEWAVMAKGCKGTGAGRSHC